GRGVDACILLHRPSANDRPVIDRFGQRHSLRTRIPYHCKNPSCRHTLSLVSGCTPSHDDMDCCLVWVSAPLRRGGSGTVALAPLRHSSTRYCRSDLCPRVGPAQASPPE